MIQPMEVTNLNKYYPSNTSNQYSYYNHDYIITYSAIYIFTILSLERGTWCHYIKVMNLQENTTTVLYYTITLCTYHLPREDDDDTSLFFVGDNDEPCREEEEEEY